MSLTEFDEEEFKRVCYEDGLADGLAQGSTQKALEAAENLLKIGVGTPDQISQAIGLPLEQILKIKEKLTVKA